MNPDEIRRTYLNITSKIENEWGERHVPTDVQNYYLLAELIVLGRFEAFIERYGRLPIDPDFAGVGKDEYLRMGDLSQFELEACDLWNQFLAKLEKSSR